MERQQGSEPFDIRTEPATILVVDDSHLSAQLVQIYLERAGYQVVLAHDGEEALARVESTPPDLIILDVMMPHLDGFTVCQQLKSDSRTWFIPIILLTALTQSRDRVRGIEAGADDFVSKPFNREELLARVRSLLRLKFARDELQTERNRLALLYSISQGINSQLALDEVLSKIVTRTREALEANMCSILIFDQDQGHITRQFVSRKGAPPEVAGPVTPAIFQKGLGGWVVRHRQSTIVRDASQDQRWLILPRDTDPVGSVIAAPLLVGQEIIGVLLATHAEPGFFDENHLVLMNSIAAQAAVAVRNAHLYEEEQRRRQEYAGLLKHTQEERAKLSAVLAGTSDAVLVIDEAGHLILANPAAEQTLRLNAASSLGHPLTGQVPPQLLEVFERVATSGHSMSAEISAHHGRTIYVSVSPVAGVGQVAVIQDITPLKELEAMRLKAEQGQRILIRQLFERYVGPKLADRILAQETGLLERRERRDVVVLFADLRRFAEMTAAFPAHAVIEVLNQFFTAMVDIVYQHQGTIFDLAGDELMVGFGAPLAQEDAAQRALQAAGEMQRTFAQMRRHWQEEQGIEIGLGIGLDRGTVVMGSIGAPSHMNFGMVGDAVNTAHRLVELAQHGETIVSEAVFESLQAGLPDGPECLSGWTFERLPPAEIRHKSAPVQVYQAYFKAGPSSPPAESQATPLLPTAPPQPATRREPP